MSGGIWDEEESHVGLLIAWGVAVVFFIYMTYLLYVKNPIATVLFLFIWIVMSGMLFLYLITGD